MLRLGLIVNPVAGLGGRVALKGSDGTERQSEALKLGAQPRSLARATQFVAEVMALGGSHAVTWHCPSGPMGCDAVQAAGAECETVMQTPRTTQAADTMTAVQRLVANGIDCLVFVGGDGTARDILAAVPEGTLTLGVPSGVKMHSGVFAVTPKAAAQIIIGLSRGAWVNAMDADVVDYKEELDGTIATMSFGELRVPAAGGYLQHTKEGGRENEPLALQEMCADLAARLPLAATLVLGPGGTLHALKASLDLAGTLRGVDVRMPNAEVVYDVDAQFLERLGGPIKLLISFTRNQGFLFGRGNQQLTPQFLKRLNPKDDIEIYASRTKLASLEGRPLLVDTGDEHLDQRLTGLVEVVTGYEDRLLYRVATDAALSQDAT